VPVKITSDRGAQFTSAVWQNLASYLGMVIRRTTAYHPQANGIVERLHRTLKTALRARLLGRENWLSHVPWVLLGIRTMPCTSLQGRSPAEAVFGQRLAIPGSIALPRQQPPPASVESLLPDVQPLGREDVDPRRHWEAQYPSLDLATAKQVWVRRDSSKAGLKPAYVGPYRVLARHEKYFVLRTAPGKEDSVSVDRLKPVIGCDLP